MTQSPGDAKPRRIAIAAGGTAGHVTPALAVAEALLRLEPATVISWFGTAQGIERHAVPTAGFPLRVIEGSPFFGVPLLRLPRAVAALGRGFRQARRHLRESRPDLVIGFGGYASAGVLLAARSLGIAVALHESNARPGLANRALGRIASGIFLAFPEAAGSFPAGRTEILGTPVRAACAVLAARHATPPAGRTARVLVLGGSLGSAFLNREAPALLADVARAGADLEVWHQAGAPAAVAFAATDPRFEAPDPASVESDYARYGIPARVIPFLDDIVSAYEWADVALSCAGNTLAELALAGIPTLAVPLAAASEDHQRANAESLARRHGLWWRAESDWRRSEVAAGLLSWLRDPQAWSQASQRMRGAASPTAALDIARRCLARAAAHTHR